MITVAQYFGGRREKYPLECSPGIDDNVARAVPLFNALIERAEAAGVVIPLRPAGDFAGSQLVSGWRPPTVNAGTPGASKTSMHMTGEAADLYDLKGSLKAWLMSAAGQAALKEIGLWMEHPSATPNWVHIQIRPPKSGKRVFYP